MKNTEPPRYYSETDRAWAELDEAVQELKDAFRDDVLAPILLPIMDWLVRVLPSNERSET